MAFSKEVHTQKASKTDVSEIALNESFPPPVFVDVPLNLFGKTVTFAGEFVGQITQSICDRVLTPRERHTRTLFGFNNALLDAVKFTGDQRPSSLKIHLVFWEIHVMSPKLTFIENIPFLGIFSMKVNFNW
jgi:hypothetical protein